MKISDFFAIVATLSFFVLPITAIIWIISAIRKKKTKAKLIFLIATAVAVSSFIAFGITYEPDPSKQKPQTDAEQVTTPTPDPTTMPELSQTPKPTATPEPTPTPEAAPTETESDYNAMIGAVEDEVQKTLDQAVADRFVEPHITFTYATGFALVQAEATENLTLNMTIRGVWRDIRDALSSITFDTEGFTLPLEDGTGMEIYALERIGFNIMAPGTDTIVIKAEFDKATIQATDWSTVTFESVAELADWTDINTDYQLK